jgi:hypothetical protein
MEVTLSLGSSSTRLRVCFTMRKEILSIPNGRLRSVLMPYVVDPSGTQLQSPPEPVIIQGFDEYVVEKVLAERKHRNKL